MKTRELRELLKGVSFAVSDADADQAKLLAIAERMRLAALREKVIRKSDVAWWALLIAAVATNDRAGDDEKSG